MSKKSLITSKQKYSSGFTIIELLVVIVIIGILATITIVSYVGITKKANEVAFTSDLANAKKQFELYKAEHEVYPTRLTNGCLSNPTVNPDPDTNYCLKSGSGNVFDVTSGDGATYDLTATKDGVIYKVTESQAPKLFVVIPITNIGSTTGTTQMGQTLTAGPITPADATVSYQWQSSATSNGTYTDIPGATANTYSLNLSNVNKYIKAKATGTGEYINTQTSPATSLVTPDSNWMILGSQVWAKTNLDVGTRINGNLAQTNNSIIEKYCYGNSDTNCITYGGLYLWDEAMNYSNVEGTQGICPTNSHLPSDADWSALEIYLGMNPAQATLVGQRGTNQGTQIKAGGSSQLNIPLAGIRSNTGSFLYSTSYAYIWTSSSEGAEAWDRDYYSGYATTLRNKNTKDFGFTVRCLAN